MKYYLITLLSLLLTLPAFGQSIKKNADGSAQVFFKDGSSFQIQTITKWQSYTSTLTGFAATPTQALQYKRNGDSISIRGSITVAGANTGTISFTLPSGLNVYTARLGNGVDGGSAHWKVGSAILKDDNTNTIFPGTILTNNTSTNDLVFVTPDGAGAAVVWAASEPIGGAWAASDTIIVDITDAPITQWQ